MQIQINYSLVSDTMNAVGCSMHLAATNQRLHVPDREVLLAATGPMPPPIMVFVSNT